MAANVKQVIALPDGNVIISYTDGSTKKVKATKASEEIQVAKQIGAYTQGNQNPTGSPKASLAFGTTDVNGAATNVSATPVVTSENLTAYYQQALSSKGDGYAKIRKALLGAGLISKGTKSLSSVQNAWLSVLQGATQDGTDPFTYISNIKSQGAGLDQTTSQKQNPYSQITVWDPTKTKDYITQLSVNLLNREPSQEELTTIGNALKDAQKKSALDTVYKTDPKTGKVTAVQTGGLDEQQFVTDLIKKNPEYATVKAAGTDAAKQKILKEAQANGIIVDPAELDTYAERVRNGQPVEEIAAGFRKIAGIAQPKNIQELLNTGMNLSDIYQPYKTAMAQTLELNPNDIKLSDPALTAAVAGDKTMTSYEFQRALRKDSRWQYTNNARSEAADVATQVLKDFGFMG